MHKKGIVIGSLASVCVLFILISLINNNKNIANKDLYNKSSDIEKKFTTLDDIRNDVYDVKNDIESGVYSNLSGDKVSIYMSDADKICSKVSEYLKWEAYDGITDPKEMLDYELSLIQYFLGTDLNPKYLLDASSLNEKVDSDMISMEELEGEYPVNNYDKICELMEEGAYVSVFGDSMPRLGYSDGFELEEHLKEYRYAFYTSGNIDMQKGNLCEIIDNGLVLEYCTSYIYTDNNLEDKYVLTDGSVVSIKECLDTAKQYLNIIPHKTGDRAELVPVRVDVYSLNCEDEDGNWDSEYHKRYVIDVIFTRNYKGMYMDFGKNPVNFIGYNLDWTYFTIIEKGEIEEINDYGNHQYYEDIGDEVEKIISLDNALDILNNSVGNNSKYEVLNIGLVYRRKNLMYNDDGNIYEKYELAPKWRVDCISEINDETRTFYIDVISGKVEYVEGLFGPLRNCE